MQWQAGCLPSVKTSEGRQYFFTLIIITSTPQIFGALHLSKGAKGYISPLVEVEVLGCEYDSGQKFTTKPVSEYMIISVSLILLFCHLRGQCKYLIHQTELY